MSFQLLLSCSVLVLVGIIPSVSNQRVMAREASQNVRLGGTSGSTEVIAVWSWRFGQR